MFADDTVLISSHACPIEASKVLGQDLKIISEYFARLKLILNAKKTNLMNFSKKWLINEKSPCPFPNLYLDNCEIEAVTSFKYLGVTLDLNLNFKKHGFLYKKSTNSKLYMLKKICDHMSNHTVLILFKAMVLPYYDFGNVFMLNCNEGELSRIQKAQNKALRIILRKDRMYRTSLLYRDARLARWKCSVLTAAMKLMFKFKHSLYGHLDGNDNNDRRTTRLTVGPIFNLDYPIVPGS